MIKKLAVIIICLVVISLTVMGKVHYDKKLAAMAEKSKDQIVKPITKETIKEDLIMLTDNMNEQLREKVIQSINTKESVSLLLIGSSISFSTEEQTISWPYSLENELNSFYGPNVFITNILNLEDISSSHLIETDGHIEIAAIRPDIIVIEPLLLNDNGFVKVEDTISNLEELIAVVKNESPEVFVIIQPSNPTYDPSYYEVQIKTLKEYAQKNDYEYLDHWIEWPSVLDEELQLYLNGDLPNEDGHRIWSEFTNNYFIANNEKAG